MGKSLDQIEAGCDLFTADSLSMEIIVACPNCNYELHLPSRDFLGRRGKCPKCEHKFEMQEKQAAPKPAIPKPEVSKPIPKPEVSKPEKIKPAKPPGKPRSDSVPVPAPGDEDFRNLEDPDFADESDVSDRDDTSDSALVPAGIWDDIETEAAPAPGPGSSYSRSGAFDALARCPHCHAGLDFKRDVDLQDSTCPRCRNRFSLIHPESPPEALEMPKQVGAYVLQKCTRIGIGPFGTVYRAKDGQTQEFVAIKVSRGGIVSQQEREKFLAKLRLVMQLKQPNIATMHEVGSALDRVYWSAVTSTGLISPSICSGLPERTLPLREMALHVRDISRAYCTTPAQVRGHSRQSEAHQHPPDFRSEPVPVRLQPQ